MSDTFPSAPRDPAFVATVVGVLSVAALFVYAATSAALTTATVGFVLLVVLLPPTVAYALARRLF